MNHKSSNEGWVLLSDARDRHLPPTSTVHHIHGCNLSNGRNMLRTGTTEELIGKVHCLRCEAVLGMDVPVGRPAEGVKIEVRLPHDVLARVDARARERGQTRAAALRELITSAI